MISTLTLKRVKRKDRKRRNSFGIDATMWDGLVTVGWLDYETRNHHGHWLITDFYVKPEYRRLKVGWVLLDKMQGLLPSHLSLQVRVPIRGDMFGEMDFLKRYGFRGVESGTDYLFTWEGE